MRCSYCGGANPDRVVFCERCGRELVGPSAGRVRPPAQSPSPARSQPFSPIQPPRAPQRQVYPPQPSPAVSPGSQRAPVRRPSAAPVEQVADVPLEGPVDPEAPALFPPRTVEQLHALEQGALAYTQIGEETAPGGKKIVRILFARCVHWQQVATLLKACKTLQQERFSTLIIQGVYHQEVNTYSFTNGQLIFDRGVRLGSQVLNRYQIDTGTSFEREAVRIVLTE